jgi:hypothetical protein
LTHSQLVEAAKRWLWKTCAVVITEIAHGESEQPDAIGWHGTFCTLIECKVSLEDFRRDGLKPFRRYPENGLGRHRYYCAPKGLLRPSMLPEGWGLLEFDGKRTRVVKAPVLREESNRRSEISILLSALRRTGAFAPSGVSVKCYTIQTLCRATLGTVPQSGHPGHAVPLSGHEKYLLG